jgi:cardiolipin synthase
MKSHYIAAFIVFAIAALTDTVDGKVARWLNQKSELGSMLDAVADRCLGAATGIALILMGKIPIWALVIFICYVGLEIYIGTWITIKFKRFYLYCVHRNSIRYFAVLLFIIIAGYVLNFKVTATGAGYLLLVSIPFAIYVFIDYTKYIATHKKWVSV